MSLRGGIGYTLGESSVGFYSSRVTILCKNNTGDYLLKDLYGDPRVKSLPQALSLYIKGGNMFLNGDITID